jgi:cystathionine beta-synthase
MTARLKTVQVNDALEKLPPIFERNEVAIVCDNDKFVGLITRIDLINHLRLQK